MFIPPRTFPVLLALLASLAPLGARHADREEPGAESNVEFGYGKKDGPQTWPERFPTCGGRMQSPINIDLDKAELTSCTNKDTSLEFKYYDALPKELYITNTGHTLALTGNWSRNHTPRISGFVLDSEYIIEEVHFHWGKNNKVGSEHLVNGQSYPLEMHAVHFKKEYGTIDEAKKHEDGLAVLGYFFKLRNAKNSALQRLLDEIESVIDPESPPAPIDPFRLEKLVPPFKKEFVSYFGSLTTPLCNEVVTWIVNLKPLHVSKKQISLLRTLRDKKGSRLVQNFRPTQPLNGRTITYCY